SSENYGDVILKVNNLKLLENNNEHISFSIKSGEIFGIAGVDGNGQLQLEESIVGLRKNEKDSIVLNNIDLSSLSSSERKKLGIAYIPSDRHKRAILHSMTIKENALLGFQDSTDFVNSGFIDYQKLGTYADELIEKFDIRVPNNEVKINNLSGGNQQKVVLARETNCDPNLIIAAQPTRGLDVGAIEFIHKNLINLKSQGKAILLISAELSEVMNLSDRIGVLFEGKLQVILDRKDFDKEKIGFYMAGNKEVKDAKK
uniref:ATP-binding cassette domain-containing protein n=1 Tax=Helcococcus kunzii TaxID=40091 RepID=UPI0024AE619F